MSNQTKKHFSVDTTLIDTLYSLSISRSATSFLISSLEVSTLFCTLKYKRYNRYNTILINHQKLQTKTECVKTAQFIWYIP